MSATSYRLSAIGSLRHFRILCVLGDSDSRPPKALEKGLASGGGVS